ncbi:MAG: sodium-dependent transporter [archaeon]|nr:sodium-dependent transporter [archaeon]
MSERTTWNNNYIFLMAMIGSAVGLGNIWRFPYIYYTNGHGTFLIPYIIAILVLGLPFIFLESSLGLKFKESLINTFQKVGDKLQIIGWLIIITVFLITTYYICIVGWDLIYFFLSFTKAWGANPATYFTTNVVQSSNVLHFVPLVGISILVIWILIWFICHKDLNDGVGKAVNILVPLMFVIMIGIVIYSLTMPGASIGIKEFFTIDWNALGNLNIWLAAFGQIIFSLSLGMGIILTYSSYLPEKTNLTKNAVMTIFANCGFEVVNAIGVFSILGFMVLTSGIPFNQLIIEGTGLAFIAFPEVFNVMGPVSYILGPIFFLCILIAGITSLISMLELISSSIGDKFKLSRKKVTTILCIIGFLVSMIYATSFGSYLLGIVDSMLNNVILLLIIIIECIIFGYIYSMDKLMEILNENTLFKVGNWWKYCIKYITPIILIILWISGVLSFIFTAPTKELIIRGALILILIIGPILAYLITKKLDIKKSKSNNLN